MLDYHRRRFLTLSGAAVLAGCTAPAMPPTDNGTDLPPEGWSTGVALPFAVQEIYPCLHAGRIHLAGGLYAEDGQITGATARHVSWAPGEPAWRDELDLWMPLHHPQLISYSGSLWTLGGFARHGQRGWIMQTECRRLSGDDWIGTPDLPAPNGESVAAVLDDTLHLCGGRRPRGEANATWSDHIDTDAHWLKTSAEAPWQPAAPIPTARNSAAGGVLKGQLHVVGGRTVGGGNSTAHEVYDPREDRWRTASPLPQGQGGLAAASLNGKLYAFGGEYFGPSASGVYPECWIYSSESDSWTRLPDMPHPRHGLGAVSLGADIYVIGGALKASGTDTTNLVEIYTP